MRDDTLRTYKDAETVIYDGQGQAHDGYYCSSRCVGCPYVASDFEGKDACYGNEYHICKNENYENYRTSDEVFDTLLRKWG